MRLSFDNTWLFTSGSDGCLYIHKVDDRDVRGGRKAQQREHMAISEEIQTDKAEMEELNNTKETLINDLEVIKGDPSQ